MTATTAVPVNGSIFVHTHVHGSFVEDVVRVVLPCVETTDRKIQQLGVHSVHDSASNFPSDNVRREGKVSPFISHENPQEKRLKGNIFFRKKGRLQQELDGPRQQRPTTTNADRQPSRHLHYDYNGPTTTKDDRKPTLCRLKQDNSDTDFSIPSSRGTYFASKHKSTHSVRVRVRVRGGWSATTVCQVSCAAITSSENPRKEQ